MNKIQTVEEFLIENKVVGMTHLLTSIMIEFAKLHVKEALKQASEKAYGYPFEEDVGYMEGNINVEIYENSILNSYSLENIK